MSEVEQGCVPGQQCSSPPRAGEQWPIRASCWVQSTGMGCFGTWGNRTAVLSSPALKSKLAVSPRSKWRLKRNGCYMNLYECFLHWFKSPSICLGRAALSCKLQIPHHSSTARVQQITAPLCSAELGPFFVHVWKLDECKEIPWLTHSARTERCIWCWK